MQYIQHNDNENIWKKIISINNNTSRLYMYVYIYVY